MRLIDLDVLAEHDDGTISNAHLGAALRLIANQNMATSRQRLAAILCSRHLAENVANLLPAADLLEGALEDANLHGAAEVIEKFNAAEV